MGAPATASSATGGSGGTRSTGRPAPGSGSAGRLNGPARAPLTLEPQIGPDYGRLSEWPRDQVVKCLVFCRPEDDAET